MKQDKESGLVFVWQEVSSAKFRCGIGSLLGANGIPYAKWQDWQKRLLAVEDEMAEEMKKQGIAK